MKGTANRILSLICALTLVISLCSVLVSAADAEKDLPTRAERRYVVAVAGTKLYTAPTGVSVLASIPVKTVIIGVASSNIGWGYDSVRTQVTYSNNTGYVINKNMIPYQKAMKVTTATHLYVSASSSSGYVFPQTMSIGTLLCLRDSSDPNYYYVRAYITSGGSTSVYSGYVQKSEVVFY